MGTALPIISSIQFSNPNTLAVSCTAAENEKLNTLNRGDLIQSVDFGTLSNGNTGQLDFFIIVHNHISPAMPKGDPALLEWITLRSAVYSGLGGPFNVAMYNKYGYNRMPKEPPLSAQYAEIDRRLSQIDLMLEIHNSRIWLAAYCTVDKPLSEKDMSQLKEYLAERIASRYIVN